MKCNRSYQRISDCSLNSDSYLTASFNTAEKLDVSAPPARGTARALSQTCVDFNSSRGDCSAKSQKQTGQLGANALNSSGPDGKSASCRDEFQGCSPVWNTIGTIGVSRKSSRGAGCASQFFHSRSQYKTAYSNNRSGIRGSGLL